MTLVYQILILIAVYLLGSIPFGALVARAHGVDISRAGSHNTGATNVFRVIGRKAGFLTLLADLLKGFIPVALFRYGILPLSLCIASGIPFFATSAPLLLGLAAILGHVAPVFNGFHGGKAVATSGGILLAFSPFSFLAGLLVFALVVLLTRFVSLSSLTGIVGALAMMAWFAWRGQDFIALPHDLASFLLTLILAAVIVIRHFANIKRLRAHQETRIHWHHEKNVQEMADTNPDDTKK